MLAVLNNHTYQFENNEVRLQKDGSPIGLEMAGAMARVVMIWWDKQFLNLAAKNRIALHLYMRYIDDQNMAVKPLAPGTRWVVGPWAEGLEGRMVLMEEHIEMDELLPADMRTMEELRKMGDSICEMIQLEEDYPSKYNDQRLPILDLKVNVQEVEADMIFVNFFTRPEFL